MNRRSLLVVMTALCLLSMPSPLVSGDDAAELVSKLRKEYDRMSTLSLAFTRTTVFAVSKARQTSEGAVSLAKGNRYRITLDDRVIVSDGATVWSWSKANEQVVVDRFRDDPNSLTPERLLVKLPAEYSSVLLGKERVGKVEAAVVKLSAQESGRQVRWFKLWVDEDELTILRLQVSDLAGNETTYDLKDIVVDRGVADSTFRFTAPPGAEVLDLR
jgi:outer membrane lipoprotein carrier protein